MDFKPFELTVIDLPKEIEIEMSDDATDADIDEMVESVRSQLIYNSRAVVADEISPSIQIIGREGSTVKLRVAKA